MCVTQQRTIVCTIFFTSSSSSFSRIVYERRSKTDEGTDKNENKHSAQKIQKKQDWNEKEDPKGENRERQTQRENTQQQSQLTESIQYWMLHYTISSSVI